MNNVIDGLIWIVILAKMCKTCQFFYFALSGVSAYITLHDLIWVNFVLSWLKYDIFSIIKVLM